MQGRHTRTIDRIGIRTGGNEVCDGFGLRNGIPPVGVGRVVQRFRATAIPGAAIGSMRDQESRDVGSKRRRRDVQGGISRVDVVLNGRQEKRCARLTSRAHRGRYGSENRLRLHTSGNRLDFACRHEANELEKVRRHARTKHIMNALSAAANGAHA